jgi:alpha-ketoglutarate-dependent taurine dioxygenase
VELVAFSDVLGVEARGIELCEAISPADASELRRVFAEKHLILFRGQDLTADDHDEVGQGFTEAARPA